ncbi:MAG: hypothetical protein MRK01_17615 [Candidatus Scalindua sp.]|nr:hypothetical protein [Candidatus Scalindua sp.]
MKRVSRLVLGLTGIAVMWLLITFSMYLQHEKSGDEGGKRLNRRVME